MTLNVKIEALWIHGITTLRTQSYYNRLSSIITAVNITATDRWTRAVFSEVFSFLNSFFTPVFNTWIIRVRPTVTQTLSDTALNKLQASVTRTDNMLL